MPYEQQRLRASRFSRCPVWSPGSAPWLIVADDPGAGNGWFWPGLVALALGLAILLWCVAEFYLSGSCCSKSRGWRGRFRSNGLPTGRLCRDWFRVSVQEHGRRDAADNHDRVVLLGRDQALRCPPVESRHHGRA